MKKSFKTRVVKVGNVEIGGDNPIIIQSMTNTDTLDVDATLKQIIRLKNVGAEIVRLAAFSKKHIFAIEKIKNKLLKKKVRIPIVADIHYKSSLAMDAVEFVEKVRINPGNFPKEEFFLFLEKCKKFKKALRIGVNLGSLSEDIKKRFGNTPLGMVESSLEYMKICENLGFQDLVISMKASDPLITIEAYTLLVEKMKLLGFNYPLHLGVTESGEGLDGRIKSLIGIGTLLLKGIGDTIRVSLTENPEREVLFAKELLRECERRIEEYGIVEAENLKREVVFSKNFKNRFLVVQKISKKNFLSSNFSKDLEVDGFLIGEKNKLLKNFSNQKISFIEVDDAKKKFLLKTENLPEVIFLKNFDLKYIENFQKWLKKNKVRVPLVLHIKPNQGKNFIQLSLKLSTLLLKNVLDGICIEDINKKSLSALLFVLQVFKKRFFKPEYISCPGCGRTLFDIEKITKKIKKKTSHLKNIKIAVMGCVVNGIGEMEDADFGILGSGKGSIDLYKGKACIEKGVSLMEADKRLISLIEKSREK